MDLMKIQTKDLANQLNESFRLLRNLRDTSESENVKNQINKFLADDSVYRKDHLLIAADLIDRAMEEVEKAGYSVAIEKLREVRQGLIKLSTYLP